MNTPTDTNPNALTGFAKQLHMCDICHDWIGEGKRCVAIPTGKTWLRAHAKCAWQDRRFTAEAQPVPAATITHFAVTNAEPGRCHACHQPTGNRTTFATRSDAPATPKLTGWRPFHAACRPRTIAEWTLLLLTDTAPHFLDDGPSYEVITSAEGIAETGRPLDHITEDTTTRNVYRGEYTTKQNARHEISAADLIHAQAVETLVR
jgi:hypothetical protein